MLSMDHANHSIVPNQVNMQIMRVNHKKNPQLLETNAIRTLLKERIAHRGKMLNYVHLQQSPPP